MRSAAELRLLDPYASTDSPYADLGEYLRDVQESIEHHWAEMMRIRDTAASEGRDLYASEARKWDKHDKELRELIKIRDDHIVDWSQVMLINAGMHRGDGSGIRAGAPTGEEKILTRDHRVADWVRMRGLDRREAFTGELDLGRYLRGLVTGQWDGADAERRAMSEGVQASGGYLVPTILAAELIDLARAQARVMQAGARIVPMASQKVDVAKWTGDPSAAWHTENQPIVPSDATIGKVTLEAKSLAALTIVSRELIEDAPNIEAELVNAFAAQLALTWDKAALYGSGTAPEPRGIKNTSGVTIQTFGGENGGTPTDWDFLVDAVGALQDANETPTAMIYAPRTERVLSTLKDDTGQYLAPPEILSGIPRYTTNQVPVDLTVGTSTDCSDVFVADWRQLLIGVRTQLVITPLRERWADSAQLGFLAWWRGDVAVARPGAFTVVTGIRG